MTHRRHGRVRPYTDAGIRRIPCYRCGRKARFQWQVCSDGRLFRPLCTDCDIALNELVLSWMGCPEMAAKMAAYRQRTAE